MAVYTYLNVDQISNILAQYQIGELISFSPISEGVENSNYFITTSQSKYILTIFEKRMREENLPFYLKLMSHLNRQNILCPQVITSINGEYYIKYNDKPLAITSFLEGKSVNKIHNKHMSDLGKNLALMHLASSDFPFKIKNDFSIEFWEEIYNKVEDKLDEVKFNLKSELNSYMNLIKTNWPQLNNSKIKSGIIHGDLFPDNVFFIDKKISGFIDFYFACHDYFIYDIAICLNAWCFENREFNLTKAKLFLNAYNNVRTISEEELDLLPLVATGAAFRFLLTRLHDLIYHDKDALVEPKNPLEYLAKVRFHYNVQSHTQYGL